MNTNILSTPFKKPVELAVSGTTEKVFQDSAAAAVVLPLPSASQLCGADSAKSAARFKVVAIGRVEGGTATNFTVKLYYGTSTTVASDTIVEASSARAVDSAKHNWMIEADLTWDSDSNKLQGWGRSEVASLYDVEATIDTAGGITSVDPDASGTLGFVVSGTFSVSNSGNKAYLDSFVLISMA